MTRETVALREYFDMKICKLEHNLNDKLNSLKEATTLAKQTMDSRLEGMNEFRAALKDQSTQFITRNEFALSIDKVQVSIKNIEEIQQSFREFRAELKAKASITQNTVSLLIAAVGIAISIYSLLR